MLVVHKQLYHGWSFVTILFQKVLYIKILSKPMKTAIVHWYLANRTIKKESLLACHGLYLAYRYFLFIDNQPHLANSIL